MALFRKRANEGNDLLEGLAFAAGQEESRFLSQLVARPGAREAVDAIDTSQTADGLRERIATAYQFEREIDHALFRLTWLAAAVAGCERVVRAETNTPSATVRMIVGMVLTPGVMKAGGPVEALLSAGLSGAERAEAVLLQTAVEATGIASKPATTDAGEVAALELRLQAEEAAIAGNLARAYPAINRFPPPVVALLTGRVALLGEDWLTEVTRAAATGRLKEIP